MKIYLYQIIFISFSSMLLICAQESAEKKEIPPAKLSIIAIGPKPPRRFGAAEGGNPNSAAMLLPPNPGEIPPRRLYFNTEEKKSTLKSINITFNNPSHFIEVPPSKSLNLKRRGDGGLNDYINIAPLTPGSMTMVLLRPSGKGDKRWVSEPRKMIVNLLGDPFKNKKLVIFNLSKRSIKSVFHTDKEIIPAGESISYEAIDGPELCRVAAYDVKGKLIYNTALRLNKSSDLLLYILYDSDPKTNDGRSVGLFRTSVNQESLQVAKETVPQN